MEITTEKIWKDLNRALFNFINSRVKNTDTANDLLQEVFIKLHLKLSTLSDKDKLTSWVYSIARNTVLDHFKQTKRSEALPENIQEEEVPANFNKEIVRCLQPFIDRLPDNYKDAIVHTELGGMSQKEYAKKTGISYSGAKSRVQRARQQLQKLFTDCCNISADSYGNITEHDKGKNCPSC